jgi:hypothetical protein
VHRNSAAVNLKLSNGCYDGVKRGERQVVAGNSGQPEKKGEEEKPSRIRRLNSATTSHADVLDANAVEDNAYRLPSKKNNLHKAVFIFTLPSPVATLHTIRF